MDRSTDLALRRMLKNWASRSKPPENGRARLLWEAAHAPQKKLVVSPNLFHPSITAESSAHRANGWSQTLFFTWVLEHSLETGMSLRVC